MRRRYAVQSGIVGRRRSCVCVRALPTKQLWPRWMIVGVAKLKRQYTSLQISLARAGKTEVFLVLFLLGYDLELYLVVRMYNLNG